jgi:dephospho-CoA kinase
MEAVVRTGVVSFVISLVSGIIDRRIGHWWAEGASIALVPVLRALTVLAGAAIASDASTVADLAALPGLFRKAPPEVLASAALGGVVGFVLGRRLCMTGVTGRIASGKSTFVKLLKACAGENIFIIDADVIGHRVLEPGSATYRALLQEFGHHGICDEEGGPINRKRLGEVVFGNGERLARINQLTHPAIGAEIAKQFLWHGALLGRHVVLDAPLLLSSPVLAWLSCPIFIVNCREDVQLERLLLREPDLTRELALERVHAQLPLTELERRAGLSARVVENDAGMSLLRAKVSGIWASLHHEAALL